PEWIPDLARAEGRPIATHLERSCGSCPGLVVPLLSEGDALGALVLLRGPEQDAFDGRVVDRLMLLAGLAALALRRQILTERLEERDRALEDSERRFRLLVEHVHDHALFMLDPVGRVVSWNAGARRIKGYEADEILGRSV